MLSVCGQEVSGLKESNTDSELTPLKTKSENLSESVTFQKEELLPGSSPEPVPSSWQPPLQILPGGVSWGQS